MVDSLPCIGCGAYNLAAVSLTHGLVPEADPEHGDARTCRLDELEADAGLVGRAGSWREHDRFRRAFEDFGDGDPIVAIDLASRTELAQIVHEVIGEAVVVIDQEQHRTGVGERGPWGQASRPGQGSLFGVMKQTSRPSSGSRPAQSSRDK